MRGDAGSELPIKFGPCANDEYPPRPLPPLIREVIRQAQEACDENARRLATPRREFLRSTCAAATVLFVLGACSRDSDRSEGRRTGGTFRIPEEATTEPSAAEEVLGGSEFIFDVQGHLLDRTIDPQAGSEFGIAANFPQRRCGEHDPRDCFSIEHFLEEVFLRSDTDMIVLSGLPVSIEHDPLGIEVMEETRRVAGILCHDDRVLLHGKVAPTASDLPAVLDGMETLAAQHPLVGWKVYTHLLGPGWWLDDHESGAPAVGEAMIRKAAEVGVPRIAVHKGLLVSHYNVPDDIGPAARTHPDVDFLVYHAGYDLDHQEGPYTEGTSLRGINRLITSMNEAEVGPNENVYADLGTTWWHLMRDPTQAAHGLGKLVMAVGEDNVVWGTDSIWYGSPQDQIQAFRSFDISEEFQERFGYPALTDELKAKVLGLNGARVYGVEDPVTSACSFTRDDLVEARRDMPGANALYGPTTRREFFRRFRGHT